jgi:hypothetical protein
MKRLPLNGTGSVNFAREQRAVRAREVRVRPDVCSIARARGYVHAAFPPWERLGETGSAGILPGKGDRTSPPVFSPLWKPAILRFMAGQRARNNTPRQGVSRVRYRGRT